MATKKKHTIWMPLYIGDYIADTMMLTTEQHGAYLLLLMTAWTNDGKLPNDSVALQQVTRMTAAQWARNERTLQKFFFVTEDFWLHNRVRTELDRAKSKTEKKAAAGAEGAAAKWGLSTGDDHHAKRSERLANARRLATHTKDEWDVLVDLCGNLCVRCGATPPLSKDHITPIYQGGSDGIQNLQPLCRKCNQSKGAESTDHRPADWLERLTERLAKRLANAGQEV
jgi:uncharacterized protein YdaU (DUF1376 family)